MGARFGRTAFVGDQPKKRGSTVGQISVFVWVAIFSLSAMVVNTIGIFLVYRQQAWAERNKVYFLCFAAGLLIASPLIIVFPQAAEKSSWAGIAALAGFIFMYFSNKLVKYKTKQSELAFGITALEGIGIHSLVDGVVYAVTFSASTAAGLFAGIGLVIHEFAEGVITFSFLVRGGMQKRWALLYAFLVAALTTPLGAFGAFPFVTRFSEPLLGTALGFVTGVLIYISASHLLPEAREHERPHSQVAFLAGIGLALVMFFIQS